MLPSQTRRVRTVHLTAPREDLIRRGALLLEDALHTASFPAASPGRLLLVKALHVGTIRTDQSAATLSLMIERRLHALAPLAVHASDPTAAAQDVVYFHDDIEPAILLAMRLARRQAPAAWFWPLAVPAWKADMSRDEALRTIFFTVLQPPPGMAAAVRLLQELAEQDTLDALLTALRGQDGPGLLRVFGWSTSTGRSTPEVPRVAPALVGLPARWRALLARWVPRWGRTDARALWLAGVALVAQNPLRLLHADIMAYAAPHLAAAMDSWAHAAMPQQTLLGQTAARRAESALRRAPLAEPGPVAGLAQSPTAADALPLVHPASGAVARHTAAHPGTLSRETQQALPPYPTAPLPGSIEEESSAVAWEPWPDTHLATAHAGLFFLIPVLARLGIVEFLTPERIEAAFPLRLLRCISQHLGLPDDDPMQALLAIHTADDPHAPFVTPASWRSGIATPGTLRLRRVGRAPGTHLLCDASGRLPLAQWHRPMPASVRAWVRQIGLRRHPQPLEGDALLHAWLTATRRWLRRQARLGLASVVRRAGRITATRTHIDVFFALDQADIRVRRVGLDIDPGWVPWLGRVISFHYEEHR